ncbi:hypothetical protein CVT24_009176 [Panaeolus cyanescens]|uniref:MICOS complex subunit MIC12 n=1 Tax=Panaeolus cyanescens TaxID=181874 RepID=A0A409Y8N5_9AGAR|nr:hypothetical protein CVT24_009176 [Panaeolus cyanescens]
MSTKTESAVSLLHTIPTEIWALAWSHSSTPQLKSLSLTCSKFHDICEKYLFQILSFEPPSPPASDAFSANTSTVDYNTAESNCLKRYDDIIHKITHLASSNKRSHVREWYFKNPENTLTFRRRIQVQVHAPPHPTTTTTTTTSLDEKAEALTATFFAVLPLFRSLQKLHLYNVQIDQSRLRIISHLPLDHVSFYRTRFTESNVKSVQLTPLRAIISTPHFSNATFIVPSPHRLESLSILSRVPIPHTIPTLLAQDAFLHLRIFHILVVPAADFHHLVRFLSEKCPNLEELGIEHVQKQQDPAAQVLPMTMTATPNQTVPGVANVMIQPQDIMDIFPSDAVRKLRRFKGCIELAHAVSRGRNITAVQIRGLYQYTKIQDIAEYIWKPLLESDAPLEDLRFGNEIAMQEGIVESIQTGVLCFPEPEEESDEVGSVEVDEEGVPVSHGLTYRGMIERLALNQQHLPSSMEELSLLYTNDETFYVKSELPVRWQPLSVPLQRRVLMGLAEHYPRLKRVVLGNVAGPYTWIKDGDDVDDGWKRCLEESWQFLKNLGPLSGALVAGGVYYGFSNLMQTRTEQHIKDLHTLTTRLTESPALIHAPPPAASRIHKDPLVTEIKSRWNHEIAMLFRGFQNLDRSAVEWGKSLLYGPPAKEKTTTTTSPSSAVSTTAS